MTTIGLICTTQVDLGLRTISGQLQARGITTRCFFLDSIRDAYPEHVMKDVLDELAGVSLVGVSLVEMGKARAICITAYLQKHGLKVVWGGAYPTLAPLEAIQYADFVCAGEGDDTMPALVEALESGGDLTRVPNLLYHDASGQVRRTDAAPLKVSLDELPFPDYFTPGFHYDLTKAGRCTRCKTAFPAWNVRLCDLPAISG